TPPRLYGRRSLNLCSRRARLHVTVSTCTVATIRGVAYPVEHEEARMDSQNSCGYLSRVVDLPVAVAEAVFDDVTQPLGQPTTTRATSSGPSLPSARAVPTRLGSGLPGAGVPVALEL